MAKEKELSSTDKRRRTTLRKRVLKNLQVLFFVKMILNADLVSLQRLLRNCKRLMIKELILFKIVLI